MPVPDYQTMMRHVLEGFAGGATNVAEILPTLQTEFAISDDEAEELIPSGRVTVLANRAHWARTYLSKAGLLRSPQRNLHKITDLGRRALQDYPDRIDNASLKSFDGFEEWRSASQHENRSAVPPVKDTEDDVPEAQIPKLIAEIDSVLESDLLAAILSLTPARFENLIVELLIAMGYGGGDAAMGKSVGRSGDGGIDGVINEDALDLDAVYIQAKRYAPENKVGRPALNAFVGSLTGEGATKGVFVTTSDYSRDAIEYVSRVQHRIILINGPQLARLMIKYEIGVRAEARYVVKRVDEDYFPSS